MINGLPFLEGLPPGLPPFVFENPIHHIILDFSGISFTDTVGCKVLKHVSIIILIVRSLITFFFLPDKVYHSEQSLPLDQLRYFTNA